MVRVVFKRYWSARYAVLLVAAFHGRSEQNRNKKKQREEEQAKRIAISGRSCVFEKFHSSNPYYATCIMHIYTSIMIPT